MTDACSRNMGFDVHEPVLLEEVMELLAVRPGGLYVDGTLGLGGHASEVLRRSAPGGRLLGFDRDPEALERAAAVLAPFGDRARIEHSRYSEIPQRVDEAAVDGLMLDLGVSSLQLDDAGRGFSFRREGPLDMRMDPHDETSAADVVNRMREAELADVIYEYGEERRSRQIAHAIVEARRGSGITTTTQLAEIVRRAARGPRGDIDPATRTFQALRIYVNGELTELSSSLPALARRLKPGGRMAVIAFHSLEDREVKNAFRELGRDGYRVLTKKPVRPGEAEVARNPRARSARLRAVEREGEAA
jgi:16S rRNA (cytosine1402-N4)-methyltransferase